MITIGCCILTYNEEIHIQRAISSVVDFVDHVFVIDSGSCDKTLELASNLGASCITKDFENFSSQRNYGLEVLKHNNYDWVLFLDADEVIDQELGESLRNLGLGYKSEFDVLFCERRLVWLGEKISKGRYKNVWLPKIINLESSCKFEREVNEQLVGFRSKSKIDGTILDNNLHGIEYWLKKHVDYALLESKDNRKTYRKSPNISQRIYGYLPLTFRVFLLFFVRYFLQGGRFSSKKERMFHWLQSFWFYLLIDLLVELDEAHGSENNE